MTSQPTFDSVRVRSVDGTFPAVDDDITDLLPEASDDSARASGTVGDNTSWSVSTFRDNETTFVYITACAGGFGDNPHFASQRINLRIATAPTREQVIAWINRAKQMAKDARRIVEGGPIL